MSFEQILGGMNISSSGLSAERLRMEVVANNIANAHSTSSSDGGPYRRQIVQFSSVMDQFLLPSRGGRAPELRGVKVSGIREDQSALPLVYNPGHPDADENGNVHMPNVTIPHEMVDLVTASRAYEANLKSLETFRELAEQALSLLRGIS